MLIFFHPVNPVKNYFLSSTDSQHQFHAWFYKELNGLARVIKATNPRNPRIHPGKKWGHGTKIMALYVRDIVLVSRYFYDSQVNGNHGAQGDELAGRAVRFATAGDMVPSARFERAAYGLGIRRSILLS